MSLRHLQKKVSGLLLAYCLVSYPMSRLLRIEFPGAWHHVMNQGAGSKDIYHNDAQRYSFLDLLSEVNNTECFAYKRMVIV